MSEQESPLDHRNWLLPEAKARILLVDDNPANLLSLQAVLAGLGQTLVEARSGQEALRQLESGEFAVILLDLRMPGTDGLETARQIRKLDQSRNTPIIFLTAFELERADLEAGYSLGAADFLSKPLQPVMLKAKVAGFVRLFAEKQQARREAEQLRLLIEGTSDYAIFLLDPEGRVASWNPGAERIKQYRAEEILGQHFSRFYPQEAIDRRWPEMELELARRDGRFEDEGWRVRKDGSQFWANVVITALVDDSGQFRGYSKITRDMTERKQAEEQARRLIEEEAARKTAEQNARLFQEQRERLRVTLASIGDAVISTDAQARITFLNPVAEQLVGWPSEEAIGRELTEVFCIVNEETRQTVENPALRALREGIIVGLANHTILIARDGAERPIDDSAAPIRDADGEVIGCVLVFRDVSERRQSENRLRLLADTIPQLAWMARPDGYIYWYNRRWYEYTGTTPSEMEGWGWQSVHDPERLPQVLERWNASLARGEPFDMIFPLRRHDGVLRPFLSRAMPLRADDGRILHWFGTNTDITELREAREALAASEERLRLALDAGRMGVWDWDIRTNKIAWADNLSPVHGLASGAFGGTFEDFQRLIHPDDRELVAQTIQRAVDRLESYEVEFRDIWPDGGTHWISGKGKVFADDAGRAERMIGICMDVTQQKRSAQTSRFLADASAALAGLVEFDSTLQKLADLAVPYFADWAAVDLAESDGSLRRVAVAHADPAKVELAHEVHRLYPPDPAAPQGVWNIVRTGQAEMMREITDEILAQSIQDEELLAIMRQLGLKSYIGVPLKVRGQTLGVITFISAESGHLYDESDLAIAQELADRAAIAIDNARLYHDLMEADRRKDEFLATLAHELRNPLAPIRNALQILKLSRVDAETSHQFREMIERQVHHLVRLVDDLLDVSRVMRGKIELRPEIVELASVVARAVEIARPLIELQGHELHLSLPEESLLVKADPVRLAQVIENLLTNAAKYSDAHGNIWLSARRDGDEVQLSVKDNGIGIDPNVLPHIFELFVQADHASSKSQGGLGIGLTLVKNLVEMHQGSVTAASQGPGKGSEFIVRLPLQTRPLQAADGPSEAEPPASPPSGNRVLVVDDNQDAANSLGMLLRLQGHAVAVAHSGPAALALAIDFQPELVFLDLGMPGMDGYEVAQKLRRIPGLESVALAALTGWGQQEDRRRTAEAGFDHHLVKPPEPKMLETLIASLKQRAGNSTTSLFAKRRDDAR